MAFTSSSPDSKVSNDSKCSKSCLETIKLLKSQNEKLLKDLKKSELMVLGYKTGLKSVEERLEFFKENEFIYLQDIKKLKWKIQVGQITIGELRKKLKKFKKKKMIVDNCKKGLGYNVVPPPHTGKFMPPKPDLSFTRLDEFANKPVDENCKAKSSEEESKVEPKEEPKVEPKEVRKQNISKAAVLVNTTRQVNAAHSKTIVNGATPKSYLSKSAHSTIMRPIQKNTTFKNSNINQRVNTVRGKNVNTARPKAVVNVARPKAVVNVVKGNNFHAVKASAYWVWKPKNKVLDHVSKHNGASITLEKFDYGNPQMDLQDLGVIDSGYSRHMIGNMPYLIDYEEIDGGYVAFGGNPKGGKITGKGSIKTATKDETSGILKSFITRIENLVDHKVKVIRSDNRTEFKNREMNHFCDMKGIVRQFSVARTPQQNGVAKRRNRTLIEAARTMLADSMLLTTFWVEAVSTACYVQNRVLVVKPQNKTPYEFFKLKVTAVETLVSTADANGTQAKIKMQAPLRLQLH
ncbi:putative ribonuclease H-like domain-containing protein [Tanacetum coccineum]